jgi:exopolysaccharide biosynthesis polyprenyl glycosylphosphotransferase
MAQQRAVGTRRGRRQLRHYDVRHERDRGHRRHLARTGRRLLRVGALCALDAAAVLAAAFVAFRLEGVEGGLRLQVIVTVLAVQILGLFAFETYGPATSRNDPTRRLRAVVAGTLLLAALSLVHEAWSFLPGQYFLFGALLLLGLEVGRRGVDGVVNLLRRKGHLWRPALVVGSVAESREIMQRLSSVPHTDLLFRGILTEEPVEHPEALGCVADLEAVVAHYGIQVVLIAEGAAPRLLEEVAARAFATGAVVVVPSSIRWSACRLSTYPVQEMAVIELQPPRIELPKLFLKRSLDMVVAGTALLLLLPLAALIALAIRLDSPGPVLFRQVRLGVGGRPFRIYKFRTMCVNAEDLRANLAHLNQYGDGRLFKIADDPRTTRIGRWLRRTSLDELPQVINVLLGDMSLVGPRPPLPEEVARYGDDHLVRLTVVPGLTGPWQVNGRSRIREFDEVVRLEREYIRDWSLWLDFKILGRTLLKVLQRDGAH